MAMDIGLFGTLRKLKLTSSSLRIDDDFVDRLNHYYTGILILLFTFIISAKQYVGQPLQCWVPATYTKAMEQYAENYCWVQNTYHLPFDQSVPKDSGERRARQLSYYQWVPFVLMCEAMLFYLPCILWRLLNWQTGVNFRAVSRMAWGAQGLGLGEGRGRAFRAMAGHVQDSISLHRVRLGQPGCCPRVRRCLDSSLCFLCSKRHGRYLTYLYLLTKLLYCANCAGQFYLLNAFLGTSNKLFGMEILINMLTGKNWEESGQFPRVTLCDFKVRTIADNHLHTVQCVLVINIFNEKIFVFLWFWFAFVFCLTALSLLSWTAKQLLPVSRRRLVSDYIRMACGLKRSEAKLAHQFADEFLRCDGVFVLRMVATNAGDIVASGIVRELWATYRKQYCNYVYDPAVNSSDIV